MIDASAVAATRQRALDIILAAEIRALEELRTLVGGTVPIKRGMITVIGTVVDVERDPIDPRSGWRMVIEYEDPFAHRLITTLERIDG